MVSVFGLLDPLDHSEGERRRISQEREEHTLSTATLVAFCLFLSSFLGGMIVSVKTGGWGKGESCAQSM